MQTTESYRRASIVDAERPTPVALAAEVSRLRYAKTLFAFAAGVSFLFSIYLWFFADRIQGIFVGLWVPSILSLGALLLVGRRDAS